MGHDYNEKQFSVHIPSMVHTRHVSLFTLLLAFWPLSHQIFSPSMNLSLSFHQRNPIGNTKWLEQLWALFQFWGTLKGTNFGLVLGLFGGLIWKFGNFRIFCDDIIMYTSKHQWKKDVESHAYCPKKAFFLTSKISPKSEIKNQTFKNELFFKGFNHQKWEKNTIIFFKSIYLVCCMCSQIYKRMIKDYFIFGL